MNARTTSLLIVLALALAACVAPMPAPPVKAPTVPEMEQPLIPSAQTEQAQNMPAVTNPWAYPDYVEKQFLEHQQKVKDEQAARLLAEQQALTDKLMTGLPMQIRDDIAIYAAIKVAELETAPATSYVLPEQMTTNPKQPAVQELDDMLKPVTLPEDLTAAKVAMFESTRATMGVPAEVQQEIQRYIEDLTLPAPAAAPAEVPYWQQPWNMLPTEALPESTMPVRDQSYLEEQDKAIREAALQTYEDMLSPEAIMGPIVDRLPAVVPYWQQPWNMTPAEALPDSTMPVRDQWYLEEQTPATAPAKDFTWENSFDKWYLDEMGYVQTAPNYVLPEQMTTNPKQPAVQELDDMLKPVPMPATAPTMEPYWENFFKDIEHGR